MSVQSLSTFCYPCFVPFLNKLVCAGVCAWYLATLFQHNHFYGSYFGIIVLWGGVSNKVALDSCCFSFSPHSDELVQCHLIQTFFLTRENKLEIR